jgi:hypothetical protein
MTLHDLHSSTRGKRWKGHVVRMGEMRGAYRILLGKLKGNRLFARPSLRREIT